MTGRFALETDGGHAWLEGGSGAPLVLVHGIGGTTANWGPVLAPLARDRHVLAWSFPGYDGAEALPQDRPTAADYAGRLADFLERRGIGPTQVAGHSLGALVVAALADAAPGRVARMDLICPVIGAGGLTGETRAAMRQGRIDEIATGGMKRFAETRTGSIVGPGAAPADLAEIVATMAGIPEAAYLQAWEMLCASDIFPMLFPGVRPATVIGGGVDPVAPPEAVNDVARKLNVPPVILPGIGHFPTYEARDRLIDLMIARP